MEIMHRKMKCQILLIFEKIKFKILLSVQVVNIEIKSADKAPFKST